MSSSGSGLNHHDVIFNKTYFYSVISSNGSLPLLTIPRIEASGPLDNDVLVSSFLAPSQSVLLINRRDLGLFHFLRSSSSSHTLFCRSSSAAATVGNLVFTDSGRCITLFFDQRTMATLRSSSTSVSSLSPLSQICISTVLSSSSFIVARRNLH